MPYHPHDNFVIRYHAGLMRATGMDLPKWFLCPITLEDTLGQGQLASKGLLAAGHVIPESVVEAVPGAPAETVPQREDVDNHFGSTIERDLIDNVVSFNRDPRRHVRRLGRGAATGPDGQVFKVFPVGRKDIRKERAAVEEGRCRPSFVLTLGDQEGKPHHFRVTGDAELVERLHNEGKLEYKWSLRTPSAFHPAVTGAWVRCAYLALFKIMPAWVVMNPAMSFVREPLARFFRDRATSARAGGYFTEFDGALQIIQEGPHNLRPLDSVRHDTFLIHSWGRPFPDGFVFAVSVILPMRIGGILVTLPFCGGPAVKEQALRLYRDLLRDRSLPHQVQAIHVDGTRWNVHPTTACEPHEPFSLETFLGSPGVRPSEPPAA